jgi:hypothetical protein
VAPYFSAVAVARPAFLVTVSIQSTKRQGNLFVNTNGTQGLCTTGSSFVIVGDQLYENGLLITANSSDGFGALAPGANGTVSGGFAIDGNGVISWSSPSFTNGKASFCLGPDGIIDAIYVQGTQPSDCVPATLSQMSGSSCPGFNPVYPGVAGE